MMILNDKATNLFQHKIAEVKVLIAQAIPEVVWQFRVKIN
jgi:hypothetical protein